MRSVLFFAVFAAATVVHAEKIKLVGYELDMDESEVLYRFEKFDPKDWTLTRNPSRWTVTEKSVVGGNPDDPFTGQVFYKTPVKGDVVLAFDARIVPPSYHDFVWCWNAEFEMTGKKAWKSGYLASLGGWWDNLSGIERLPNFEPQTVSKGFELEPGRTYRVVSGSSEGRHFIAVDGKLVTWFIDREANIPDRPGYFGFGVYRSMVEYSNLTVYRPCVRKIPHGYEPASQLAAAKVGRKYLVVDLSGGPEAVRYPMRETDEPPDVAGDACRGDELWLRRVGTGSYLTTNGAVTSVSRPYYIGVFEVTQKQWKNVMGTDPSEKKGDFRPVEKVSYDDMRGKDLGAGWPKDDEVDAGSFFGRLRAKTGHRFDLPTSAQWEFACRAGTSSLFHDGTDGPNINGLGRCKENKTDGVGGYAEHTRVGSYKPNAWGIYDMHGNVWENTLDWRRPDKQPVPGVDPRGPEKGNGRLRRGGSWCFPGARCMSPNLGEDPSDGRFNDLGFRVSAPPYARPDAK